MTRAPESRPGGADAPPATLEAFVARLHDDGVQAGRREAEELRAAAEARARQLVERAEADAERIVAAAEARAATELARGKTELRFAIRDALLELRAALSEALAAVVRGGARATLEDPVFLRELLRAAVDGHAAVAGRQGTPELRVADGLQDALASWAMGELGVELARPDGSHARAVLAGAGFELHADGVGIEVTEDAAVEKLMELLSPRLKALFAEADDGVEAAAGAASASGV